VDAPASDVATSEIQQNRGSVRFLLRALSNVQVFFDGTASKLIHISQKSGFAKSDCCEGSYGSGKVSQVRMGGPIPKPDCSFSSYDERIDMNGDSPATKHDLEQLRSEVKQDLEQLRSEVKQDLVQHRSEVKQEFEQVRSEANHIHDDLVERIRDSETRLLQAFYSFADANNKRLVQGEAATALVISRITTLEDRVLGLEKRLNIPPS
jgi:hypothetical protein